MKTQSESVLAVVSAHPGSTGAELYQFFDIETWDREQVFKLLAKLHKAGRVRRQGEGGKMGPLGGELKPEYFEIGNENLREVEGTRNNRNLFDFDEPESVVA